MEHRSYSNSMRSKRIPSGSTPGSASASGPLLNVKQEAADDTDATRAAGDRTEPLVRVKKETVSQPDSTSAAPEDLPDIAAGFTLRDADGVERNLDVVTSTSATDDPFLCLDYISDHASEPEEIEDSPGTQEEHSPGGAEAGGATVGPRCAAGTGSVGGELEADGNTDPPPPSAGSRVAERRAKARRKTKQKWKRVFDKKLACLYCDAKLIKLGRHLERKHANEREVIEAFSYPAKSMKRRQLLIQLVKKGNFRHNTKVLLDGHGQIIPSRLPARGSLHKKHVFVSCDQCLGFYSSATLLRHKINFHGMSHPEEQILCEDPASTGLQKLLSSMEADDISVACKTDMLILRFASRMFSKLTGKSNRESLLCQRIRELGALLLEFRKHEQVASLQTCLDPTRFERVTDVVRKQSQCGDAARHPCSFLRAVGKSLSTCARILKVLATMAEDESLKRKACGFLDVYKKEWHNLWAPGASKKSRRESSTATLSCSTGTGVSERARLRARKCQKRAGEDSECSDVDREAPSERSHNRTEDHPERSDVFTEESSGDHDRREGLPESSDVLTEERSGGHDRRKGLPESSDVLTEERSGDHDRTESPPEGTDLLTEGPSGGNNQREGLPERSDVLTESCSGGHDRRKALPESSDVLTEERSGDHDRTESLPEGTDVLTEGPSGGNRQREGLPERSDVITEKRSGDHDRREGLPEGSDVLTEGPSGSQDRTEGLPERSNVLTEERSRMSDKRAEERLNSDVGVHRDACSPDGSDTTTEDEEAATHPSERNQGRRQGAKRKRSAGHRSYKRRPWSPEEKEAVTKRLGWFVRNHVCPGIDYCQDALEKEAALSKRTWRDVKYCVYNLIQRSKRKSCRSDDSD